MIRASDLKYFISISLWYVNCTHFSPIRLVVNIINIIDIVPMPFLTTVHLFLTHIYLYGAQLTLHNAVSQLYKAKQLTNKIFDC